MLCVCSKYDFMALLVTVGCGKNICCWKKKWRKIVLELELFRFFFVCKSITNSLEFNSDSSVMNGFQFLNRIFFKEVETYVRFSTNENHKTTFWPTRFGQCISFITLNEPQTQTLALNAPVAPHFFSFVYPFGASTF